MKKVVSVIIPVYNVEEFIFRTVESVMNQDYKNIEIILVDDGSLDNSAKIINELAKKDDRITCVHKENGGVLSARNAGLRIASGEYVTFIDGDDWVEPKYISCLLNLVESNKCEIGMNKNNYSDYYHWLPRNDIYQGGYINFRKVITYSPEDFAKEFEKSEVKVQEFFVKSILNRFSAYYARQGQPDFKFKDESEHIFENAVCLEGKSSN